MVLKYKILLAVFLSFLVVEVMGKIVLVTSESIDKRLLLVDVYEKEIERDIYVNYKISSDVIGDSLITKKISCYEGDFLEIKRRRFFCNGVFIGEAKMFSTKGQQLTVDIKESLIIEEGYSFLSGTHENSYDSRYFGLVKNSDLVRLRPIF